MSRHLSFPHPATVAALLLTLVLAPGLAIARTAPVWAKGEPFSVEARELLAAAEAVELDHSADVVVLLEEHTYRFDDEGRAVSTLRRIYHVRGQAAVDGWGVTEVYWSPWYQARPELKARVVTPGGREVWLEGSQVSDAAVSQYDPTIFSDQRILRAPLPAVAVGVVVEEVIEERDEKAFLAAGTVQRIPIGNFVPTELYRVTIETPRRGALSWNAVGIEPEARRIRTKDTQGVTLELEQLQPFEPFEPYLPYEISPFPYIEFSTAPSWKAVMAEYYERTKSHITSAGLEELVQEIGEGDPGRDVLVARALDVARSQIRYTGVEFGQQAIVPYTPAESIHRGYGDCKDKATLMVSLLTALGVEAEVALLRAAPGTDVVEEMPGLNRFDHAIVHVPGDPEYWIDPTSEFTPLGQLPLMDQGRMTLLVREDTTGLTPTPVSLPADNSYREERRIGMPLEGTAAIQEVTQAGGWIGGSMRWDYADTDPAVVGDNLAVYATGAYAARELVNWSVTDPRDLEQPFSISLSIEGTEIAQSSGGYAILLVFPSLITERLPEILLQPLGSGEPSLADRTHPVALPPHRAEVVYRVTTADGYQPRQLPDSRVRRFGPVELSEEYGVQADGSLLIHFVMDTGSEALAPADAEALRQAIVTMGQEEPLQLEFDQAAELHLALGRNLEALEGYRALVDAHPGEGVYRSLYAVALMAAGLGEPARAEGLQAVQDHPQSAAAWRYLGYIRMHDLFGRELRWGYDRSGAIEAFDKAVELNPDDVYAMQNLALVLERDERGSRFGAGADLERAAQIYRQRREQSEMSDLDVNLLSVLFHLGRHDELRQLVEDSTDAPAVTAMLVASMVMAQGVEVGITEANRRSYNADQKRAILSEAAGELIGVRHYSEAAGLLRAAATGSPNPVEIREQAANLDGLQPYQEVLAQLDRPETAPLRMLAALMRDPIRREELADVLSRDVIKDDGDLDDVIGNTPGYQSLLRQMGLSEEVLLDLTCGSTDSTVDGDDRSGYRVATTTLNAQIEETFFVVKERGQYRIRTTSASSGELGSQAFTHLSKGDLESARLWLDWAYEIETPRPEAGPFDVSPFAILWRNQENPGRDRIRVAAAALMCRLRGKESLAVLERALDDAEDEEHRTAIQRAMMAAYGVTDQYESALLVADMLVDRAPAEPGPRATRIYTLASLGRFDEAREAAEQLMTERPDDLMAMLTAMSVAQEAGDGEQVQVMLRRIVDSGKARAWIYNELAWRLLVTEESLEEATAMATRAVTVGEGPNNAHLHTLAVAQSEASHAVEAHEVLVLAMEHLDNSDHLPPVWWHVVGRIAELYGQPEYALEAYSRVPEEDDELATCNLTRKHVARLSE